MERLFCHAFMLAESFKEKARHEAEQETQGAQSEERAFQQRADAWAEIVKQRYAVKK